MGQYSAHQAQARPNVVEFQRLLHEVNAERHKDDQRDDLLYDLELPHVQVLKTQSIGGHLQHVFKKKA